MKEFKGYNAIMAVTKKRLRQLVIDELESLNFTFDGNGEISSPTEKEAIKLLHKPSRDIELRKSEEWIKKAYSRYQDFFANGSDIDPTRITPELVRVKDNWQNDLFRIARYFWSIPYSYGFGRRLRYLILDNNNKKLIGIFGLQSPPISFPSRDRLFSYPEGRKTELVNQTMDIYTLGAIPPYNRLLAGKLVALSVTANEVRKAYRSIYSGKKTEMEGRVIPAHLVALTTTSAFGRSSIYNRLKYNGIEIAESLGFTNGYGNFHFQRLYPLFKEYLASKDIDTQGGYGTGPKRSWQLIRRTLDELDLPADLLKHGVKREAFLFRLVDNLEDYMNGKAKKPQYRNLPFNDLAKYWKTRWLEGRYNRVDGWHSWNNEDIFNSMNVWEEKENERPPK